eukprot:121119-Pelagomonas_calceolata.AAC.1
MQCFRKGNRQYSLVSAHVKKGIDCVALLESLGSLRRMQSLLAWMQVRSGRPLTYDKAKRWTIPYGSGCQQC